uniref:HAD hydrolase-like protein n=1 Tax=Planktothrix agardhii TaxID=1160 RepID=UPI0033409EC5
MPNFRKITHVIYDLDGLLLDTEPLHTKVNQMVANYYGKTIDHALSCKVRGRKSHDSVKLLIQELELSVTIEQFLERKDAIIYQLYPHVLPLEGAV